MRLGNSMANRLDGIGGSAEWGGITGTLSNQTDLQNALNAKLATVAVDGITITGDGTPGDPLVVVNNASQVSVDFGANEQNLTTSTVSAPWVTTLTILSASVAHEDTADHTADEAMAEGIIASCGNIVDGVSFDLTAFAPNCTWGEYKFNVIGV